MSTCIAVFGPPGSGKTTLCRQFAEQNSHAVTMLSIGEAVRASATNRDWEVIIVRDDVVEVGVRLWVRVRYSG